MTEANNDEDSFRRFTEWLEEEGWEVKEAPSGEHWRQYEYTRADQPAYRLIQPEQEAPRIILGIGFPGEDFNRVLEDIAEDRRRTFLWDLRLDLLKFGIEFSGIEYPTENITLSLPIYLDGASRDRFMRGVRRLKNSAYLLNWTVAAEFDIEEQSDGSGAEGHP